MKNGIKILMIVAALGVLLPKASAQQVPAAEKRKAIEKQIYAVLDNNFRRNLLHEDSAAICA
jgi:hypothetical protein